jgi:hypothetical protein
VMVKPPVPGTYTFSVRLVKGGNIFGGKHIQWHVAQDDPKNYVLYQIDKKSLQSRVVTEGKEQSRPKIDLDSDEPFTVQVEVGQDVIITRLREGDKWEQIDKLEHPDAASGKFGFVIPGNDELAVSHLTFTPK